MSSSEQEFIVESEDLLDEAVSLLLGLREAPLGQADPDSVNALFRIMHTLKGMSGIYGYQGLTEISHSLESLLDDIRMGNAALTENVITFLFRSVDLLRSILGGMKNGALPSDEEIARHLGEITSFRESLRGESGKMDLGGIVPDEILRVLSEYEEHRLKSNIKDGKSIYLMKTVFSLSDFDTALKGLSVELKKKAEIISTMPTSENVPPGSIGFRLLLGTRASAEEIRGTSPFEVEPLVAVACAPVLREARPEEAESTVAGQEAVARQASSTLRVDIGKIDHILNTIEEISLSSSSIRRIWDEMVDAFGYSPLLVDIQRVNQGLERWIARLQEQVLEIRMVPIGQMFSRLSQIIRRYVRDQGKKIDLNIFGEDTEFDKALAEDVIDPLVHLVRNAIDHGLEPPAERLASGKAETGRVSLRAFQSGNNVVIEVTDDGRGIDAARVRAKAVEKGLIPDDSAIEDADVLDLIFTPGFSTRETVSEVSGRGVGLDIVRRKLAAMGGVVEIETLRGKGTTFRLKLPITLAIIKSLILRTGGETFALPIMSLNETQVLDPSLVQSVEGLPVYNLRGEMVPVVHLSEFLGLPGESVDHSFIVFVGAEDRQLALVVDHLQEQHDVVVKPLGEYFDCLPWYAGAAEVGKHEVILVLDVESIVRAVLDRAGNAHV
jgi:two-component system chemotaxis sensor kinase CheA